jgi:N-glycosidase YbiA
MSQVIHFYDPKDKYGEFSNYYGKEQNKTFKLSYKNKSYNSVEHFFQAFKFMGPLASKRSLEYAEIIRNQSTANKAKILANQKRGGGYKWRTDLNSIIDEYKDVKIRSDWEEIKDDVMRLAVCLKMHQNPAIYKLLLSTKQSKLAEHTTRDKYWGDGGDGSGKNMLGRILVEIRDKKVSKRE